MTTATTTTVLDQSTDAAFRTWVAEVITALFTTIGLTQTSDTGQINTSTVTRQATINTAAGYVIGRFNDSLQSTSPIFFKLEFGTATTTLTSPSMWITVGTGSNGSGTLTGTTSVRQAIATGNITSTTTPYPSYWCYKTGQGYFGMAYKTTSASSVNCFATTIITRTTDSSGAPTANGYLVLTVNSATPSTGVGQVQVYNYTSGTILSTLTGIVWCASPFIASASLVSGNASLFPCWQADPVLGINANFGLCVQAELPVGTTTVAALVSTTTHTFVSIAAPYGNIAPGGQTNTSLIMLYE